jgi:hypothetical protein
VGNVRQRHHRAFSSWCCAGCRDLRQPGDRVAADALVDRDEAGVVLIVQRTKIDADERVVIVERSAVAVAYPTSTVNAAAASLSSCGESDGNRLRWQAAATAAVIMSS